MSKVYIDYNKLKEDINENFEMSNESEGSETRNDNDEFHKYFMKVYDIINKHKEAMDYVVEYFENRKDGFKNE